MVSAAQPQKLLYTPEEYLWHRMNRASSTITGKGAINGSSPQHAD